MQQKVRVIIPAYNEERSIGKVISDIPKKLIEEVIVVNNGSSDQTANTAENAGATVLTEQKRGYGYRHRYRSDHSAWRKFRKGQPNSCP